MTLVSTPTGIYYPNLGPTRFHATANGNNLNAATDKTCLVGHVYWEGRASSKVISSSGGQIKFRAGAVTFANGSTTIDVGIQDVDAANGPVVRGDGTFDVKKTLTGGTDTISANAWSTFSMASGSKTIAHGDLVAVVFDMTARGGADSVIISNQAGPSTSSVSQRPVSTQFESSAWGNLGQMPNIILVADDGTLGVFDGTIPIDTVTTENYSDGTNPDERGTIFQVPWACKIDAYYAVFSGASAATADCTFALYADPTGTPSAVSGSSVNVLGENFERSTVSWFQILLPAEISLSANTDYCLAIKGTAASNVQLGMFTLPDTNARKFISGGTTIKKATRNNGSGAFTAESPAVTIYQLGVRISQLHDGTSSGVGVIGS